MHCKLVNITSLTVFKKYSKRYNIFRDLYEVYSFGLEVKDLSPDNAQAIQKLFLHNGDFCYLESSDHDTTNLLALGTISKLKENAGIVRAKINEEIGYSFDSVLNNYENYDNKSITIGDRELSLKSVNVMGILNVTPDSFSDGGKYYDKGVAVEHALKLLKEGADIIDIGGESTRPGSKSVSVDEELDRVIPVINEIKSLHPDTIISIDTTKSKVAEESLLAGAQIVNDVSGMTFDPKMADVVSNKNAAIVLMHMKGKPETMQNNPGYADVFDEVYEFLYNRIKFAKKNRISKIIIDPGFGFGKTLVNNFELLSRINEFKSLGYPILAGISRKTMLGNSLNLEVNDREIATIIAETIAVTNGVRFIRTHNVANAAQLKKLVNFVNNPEFLPNV